jgi:Family of unknown function (DUF6084)
MTSLAFSVIGARADCYAAAPTLVLRLRITESTGAMVDAIALRVQIQLEVQRRRYTSGESELLTELFGGPGRYADTLKPMLWTHVSQMVVAFQGTTDVDLAIPCSYDFEVAAHKYLASLRDGIIPINLLFSGMVFVEGATGVTPEFVPWTCEARYALPVATWRDTMDAHFPNAAWIRVDRELFDELRRFKISTGLPTWNAALTRLCDLARARS